MKSYLNTIALLALIASVSIGCGGTTDAGNPAVTFIKGKVTNRSSGDPIANASITTSPPTQAVTTGLDGTYVISDVAPNTYTVTASKGGYADGTVDVTVAAGKQVIADVQLDSGVANTGPGQALRYDGNNAYVSVANSSSLSLSGGSFTVEAWVNPTSVTNSSVIWNVILNKSHSNTDLDYLLGIDNNGRFSFITRSLSNFIRSNTIASINAWYHVAGVQDVSAGKVTLYVNGEQAAQTSLSGAPTTNNAPLFIGAREYLSQGRASDMFNGTIDEVRIWNTARTREQITSSMYRNLTGNQPGLLANWKFEEGSGVSTFDVSKTYAGQLIGGPLWVASTAPIQ